ncbi:uncharacterized mitochondrial protein-like protein [Tanacetum coccineum]
MMLYNRRYLMSSVFLNGDLNEEVFIKPPPSVSHKPGEVCKLRKALDGLKQCWMYTLSLYVDDIIINGDDCVGIESLKLELAHRDLLDRARITDKMVEDIPIDAKAKYTPTDGDPLQEPSLYRNIVGSLVYLIVIRPDISYAVYIVSQFVSAPTMVHWAVVLHILNLRDESCAKVIFLPVLLLKLSLLASKNLVGYNAFHEEDSEVLLLIKFASHEQALKVVHFMHGATQVLKPNFTKRFELQSNVDSEAVLNLSVLIIDKDIMSRDKLMGWLEKRLVLVHKFLDWGPHGTISLGNCDNTLSIQLSDFGTKNHNRMSHANTQLNPIENIYSNIFERVKEALAIHPNSTIFKATNIEPILPTLVPTLAYPTVNSFPCVSLSSDLVYTSSLPSLHFSNSPAINVNNKPLTQENTQHNINNLGHGEKFCHPSCEAFMEVIKASRETNLMKAWTKSYL